MRLKITFLAAAFALASLPASAETIKMELEGGTYMVPVRINDAITIPFTVDSGAASVVIPADVFSTLARTGSINKTDLLGPVKLGLAAGAEETGETVVLRSVAVGNHMFRDVEAVVVSAKGDPLLGQTFLSKLPGWSIDNRRHAMILAESEEPLVAGISPPQRVTPTPTTPVTPNSLPSSFDRFSITNVYHGPQMLPDFEGRDRKFKSYRTRIRNGIHEGPNFAGRYKVIQIGCGTGCSDVLVADVSTGRVYNFPHGGEYDQALNLEYRVYSKLIRSSWMVEVGDWDNCFREDLVFDVDHFTSLGKFGPVACFRGSCEDGVCKSYHPG